MTLRIALLASDEATAPLYRVRALARLLMRRFEVTVPGFVLDPAAVDPGAPRDFPYTPVVVEGGRGFRKASAVMRGQLDVDLVYAMKPRPSSFGVAMAHRRATGTPVVVDVDDEELAMIKPWSRYKLKNALYAMPQLHRPNNYLATWWHDRMITRADGVTAVSTRFQGRYGGILAHQYVDTELYDPARFDALALRAERGLADAFVIVFAGIAHPAKGLEDVVTALKAMPDAPDWRLLVVGPVTPTARAVAATDFRVRLVGTVPPTQTPMYLAMADMVVLPQRAVPAAHGQMPMKLFEAMAMARPIVATALADIPAALDGCGEVVAPGDPGALVDAIGRLMADPARAQGRGQAARDRVLARYSWEVGARDVGDYLWTVHQRSKAAKGTPTATVAISVGAFNKRR